MAVVVEGTEREGVAKEVAREAEVAGRVMEAGGRAAGRVVVEMVAVLVREAARQGQEAVEMGRAVVEAVGRVKEVVERVAVATERAEGAVAGTKVDQCH